MYQFTDDCLTGIEIIDNEHRRLFALCNGSISIRASFSTFYPNCQRSLFVIQR